MCHTRVHNENVAKRHLGVGLSAQVHTLWRSLGGVGVDVLAHPQGGTQCPGRGIFLVLPAGAVGRPWLPGPARAVLLLVNWNDAFASCV